MTIPLLSPPEQRWELTPQALAPDGSAPADTRPDADAAQPPARKKS